MGFLSSDLTAAPKCQSYRVQLQYHRINRPTPRTRRHTLPQHTIGLLGARIVHTQTDVVVHPANFGPNAQDLLDEWKAYMTGIGHGGGVRSHERFFTLESGTQHTALCEFESELDYGHFGSNRRVRDSGTGNQTGSIATTEVASDGLRVLHRVPRHGMASYIACEQIGRASVTGVLVQDFKKWFAARHGDYRVEIDYIEEAEAWNDFLDGASLRELTFVAEKPAVGNRAGRPTKELYDVQPGRRGDVLPRRWLDQLRSDGRIPPRDVLSVPVNEADINETRVVVEKNKRRRTIRIGDEWPRFTWEIVPDSNARPSDTDFRAVARQIIEEHLVRLGIDT